MKPMVQGLHHVTSLASSASTIDAFLTQVLGLRRVKKTVNFDAPEVYHLYYGDSLGRPGSVMTYFPFPKSERGTHGTGEVGTTAFSIPPGTVRAWTDRLAAHGAAGLSQESRFGDSTVSFDGPDGERFCLIEAEDNRPPWTDGGIGTEVAIRGLHSVSLRLADTGPMAELLELMGYRRVATEAHVTRYVVDGGNAAQSIDLEHLPHMPAAQAGAGAVHHIAFSVPDRATQQDVRQKLTDAGFRVTPPIDRDYFWAVYFRTPGGVLFEVATDVPGFDRDEPSATLGTALKLPTQHAHLRDYLEREVLEPLDK